MAKKNNNYYLTPSSNVPTISIEKINSLKKFLDSKRPDKSFPSISIFPDMLGSVLTFVNERKMMRIDQEQLSKKIAAVNGYIDKQYDLAVKQLNSNTAVQLASIKGDVQCRLNEIDRRFDAEIRRIENDYNLKREGMILHYELLENYRKDQRRRFDRMMGVIKKQRGEMSRAIKEMEDVTKYLQKKIVSGTASSHEMEYYLLVMQLRVDSIKNMGEAICEIAGRIE